MNKNQGIKQDINFLEKPLWFPVRGVSVQAEDEQESDAENGVEKIRWFKDVSGYKYKYLEALGKPSKVDIMILYYLLMYSQDREYKEEIKITKYALLAGCGIVPTKERKQRLKRSLDIWQGVKIEFTGSFYDGKKYDWISFGIIDVHSCEENSKSITIRFNKEWLQVVRNSGFYKYISFKNMRLLRSPVAMRLYEVLSKSFYQKNDFKISAQKLAAKMPLPEKHYSKIKEKIIPAVNKINQKTELNIKLQTKKTGKNDGLFTFTKLQKSMLQHMQNERNGYSAPTPESPVNVDYDKEIPRLLGQLSETEQKRVEEAFKGHITENQVLMKKYKKDGFENAIIKKVYLSFIRQQISNQGANE